MKELAACREMSDEKDFYETQVRRTDHGFSVRVVYSKIWKEKCIIDATKIKNAGQYENQLRKVESHQYKLRDVEIFFVVKINTNWLDPLIPLPEVEFGDPINIHYV
jgi:hypothetical protein